MSPPESGCLVVTGLPGAGRSVVADHLEDLGWRVVRNLPAGLVGDLLDAAGPERVALVPACGEEDQARPPGARVLFLTASPEALVRRYNETRRAHPGAVGTALLPAIERDADRLAPVRATADVVLDTTELSKHDLRRRITATFGSEAGTQVTVQSFGFKHGLPLDADLVFDCRFLPNPHWIEELRPGTGRDAPVRDYVLGRPGAGRFLDRLEEMLADLLPAFAAERKTYLTVGVGCTGGRHRSVAVTEEVARRLRERGVAPIVLHRDVDR